MAAKVNRPDSYEEKPIYSFHGILKITTVKFLLDSLDFIHFIILGDAVTARTRFEWALPRYWRNGGNPDMRPRKSMAKTRNSCVICGPMSHVCKNFVNSAVFPNFLSRSFCLHKGLGFVQRGERNKTMIKMQACRFSAVEIFHTSLKLWCGFFMVLLRELLPNGISESQWVDVWMNLIRIEGMLDNCLFSWIQ